MVFDVCFAIAEKNTLFRAGAINKCLRVHIYLVTFDFNICKITTTAEGPRCDYNLITPYAYVTKTVCRAECTHSNLDD
jgi:hypothetical protein